MSSEKSKSSSLTEAEAFGYVQADINPEKVKLLEKEINDLKRIIQEKDAEIERLRAALQRSSEEFCE